METKRDENKNDNDKSKFKEPFRPEDTPTPPQVMDPSVPPEGNEMHKGHTDQEKDKRKKSARKKSG